MRLSLLSTICWASTVLAAFDFNRAGAVLKAPTSDSFKSVTGSFAVPSLTGNNRLSIWVGIGDSTTQTYVLGGGVSYNKTLSTWTAFFPSPATDTTSSVPAANGDNITVTVDIELGAGGSVTIENKTQNKKATQAVAAPSKANPDALTALAADWWVQAYQVIPGELVQTPNFTTIVITGCSATTEQGVSVPLSGAGAYEIQGTR
ncbi:concanavalin A-like lectin/glucanase [Massarina eburnea CBS 473.64]|uniref:Concanavalin A-like lectin/glucanase n=1 Tax=Massarina eburnea CBS 473.64 TaxID=1395130 RepID=A0A6A6RZ47_9PLEO|nr:concanavalin A-like lectin/glucanase [Massarina eburnea CBS 473.64]